VSYGPYSTFYSLDALVAGGGAFEFKTVEVLTPRHCGQLYNYLLMLDLAHGKIVNMRPESIDHEFVNATVRPEERHAYQVVSERWSRTLDCGDIFQELLVEIISDWGTGLELSMYEAALTYFLGGEGKVAREVTVRGDRHVLGHQTMRHVCPDVVFRLTAFDHENNRFEEHARRLLRHVDLRAILWVNIGLHCVTFTTIE
jgi:hypothetical protein